MGLMNPYDQGVSLCLFDLLGFSFCPGEGLGHSISFLMRGDIHSSFEANLMGPIAVGVLVARIATIWKLIIRTEQLDLMEN